MTGKQLSRQAPMTMISLRLPREYLSELKEMAPRVGFAGYQPLIRAYISRGLAQDRARLRRENVLAAVGESLRQQGVAETVIEAAVSAVLSPERIATDR